jgi:SSS family solute:Na+ symporter
VARGNYRAKRLTHSVADFLAANRSAGPYLLATAEGTAGMGAVSIVARLEQFGAAGFVPTFWGLIGMPVGLVITLTGFVRWRYRATRCLTVCQFFEYRYGSRRLRVMAGLLCWVSGVINMGIFPGVGTRFFINFCNLDGYILGVVPTYPVLMAALLSISVYLTISGGQIAVIVTDFLQGIFCTVTLLCICAFIGGHFAWSSAVEALEAASQPSASLFNPFDIDDQASFGFFYYVSTTFMMVYHTMSWQGDQGYNCAAKDPHSAQVAVVIGRLRGQLQSVAMSLLPLAAMIILYAAPLSMQGVAPGNRSITAASSVASKIEEELHARYPDSEADVAQQRVPLTLREVLPSWLAGAFAAAMLGFFLSTHTTYLHTWAAVLIQDVILPLTGPQTRDVHLRWLRWATIFVAVLIFLWSWLVPTRDFILMFMSLSGAIWNAGAGACIIGGLYWPRGTALGAGAALVAGASTSIAALWLQLTLGTTAFPYNGNQVLTVASGLSVCAYVACSLSCGRDARGEAIVAELQQAAAAEVGVHNDGCKLRRAVGTNHVATAPVSRDLWEQLRSIRSLALQSIGLADGPQASGHFSRAEKALVLMCLLVGGAELAALLLPCLLFVLDAMPDTTWLKFWHMWLWCSAVLATLFSVWFVLGGLRDLLEFERQLQSVGRDDHDNGSVQGHTTTVHHRLDPDDGDSSDGELDASDEQGFLLSSSTLARPEKHTSKV